MPIYEYRCSSCGAQKDVMQKIGDAPLTDCPECGQPTFTKQLSAAGFQLKGSGWDATDFKGGGSKPAETAKAAEAKTEASCGTSCACAASGGNA